MRSGRATTLFGKPYRWHHDGNRWSLTRIVQREGADVWKLLGETEDGKRLYAAMGMTPQS